jgi:hypothetical protein
MSAARKEATDYLESQGVQLTAGQKTGSKGLQYAESELGGMKAENFTENQAEQFTKAALGKAGIGAQRATPEVMDRAFTQIGGEFDRLVSASAVPLDRTFLSGFANAFRDYKDTVSVFKKVPLIENTFKAIANGVLKNGAVELNGSGYQTIRRRLGELSRNTSDPEARSAARTFIDLLDDAAERYLVQNGQQGAVADWQQVRRDYRNMVAIEDAVSRAGEKAVTGIITPANLRTAVAKQNKRSYVRGYGDMNQLARAGVETMTPLPQSGTAPRQAVRAMQMSVPSIVGAAAGSGAGLPGTIAGAALGGAVPFAAGRAMLSGPGRAYLSNNLMSSPAIDPRNLLAPSAGALANTVGRPLPSGR